MASSASDRPLEVCTMSEMPSSAISFSVGRSARAWRPTAVPPRAHRAAWRRPAANARCPWRSVGARDRDDPARNPGLLMRFEQLGVDAEGHHPQLVGADAEVVGDVGGRRRRHRQQVGDAARDLLLHLGEAIPPVHQRLSPPLRGGQVQHPVPGDGVVHGGDDRQPPAAMRNRPVPRHWLSWTTSNSSRRRASSRAARRLNVRGSGSPRSTSSRAPACRCGRGSRRAAAPGTGRVRGRGRGWPPR